MALTALTLKNFQAHRLTKLELSPTVTTIIGSTDRGKSAIIRALRWVALNDPSGTSFIRHGKKQATVSVSVGSESSVKRHRSDGGSNTYTLTKKGRKSGYTKKGRKSGYKAFGKGVPDPVLGVLKMRDINFQSQHDAPFWFSDSPPEVSRQLNMVINLSLIDRVQSDMLARLRKAKIQLESSREALRAAKHERDELDYVPKMAAAFRNIQAKVKTWQELYAKVDSLRRAIQDLRLAKKALRKPVPDMSKVDRMLKRAKIAKAESERFGDMLHDLHHAIHALGQAKIAHKRHHAKFHTATKGETCPLCKQKM